MLTVWKRWTWAVFKRIWNAITHLRVYLQTTMPLQLHMLSKHSRSNCVSWSCGLGKEKAWGWARRTPRGVSALIIPSEHTWATVSLWKALLMISLVQLCRMICSPKYLQQTFIPFPGLGLWWFKIKWAVIPFDWFGAKWHFRETIITRRLKKKKKSSRHWPFHEWPHAMLWAYGLRIHSGHFWVCWICLLE